MNRRRFLLAGGTALLARGAKPSASVRINVDSGQKLGAIPPNFIGLGYEISSIAEGVLTAANGGYVSLVKQLSAQGVVRIGGNTADYAHFVPSGNAVSAPKATVINDTNLRALGTFLDATGWCLIWALNLGRGTPSEAAIEAQAVANAVGNKLLAFEIGNEPDLFGHAHRDKGYSYDDYLREYRGFKAAIRQAIPHAPFAGPDAATATDWVSRFAADEGADLKLLTHHYYRECASPLASLDRLLHTDPKLEPQLQQLKAAAANAHPPYRICEVNSLCGGGKPGVSDTFGSALWVLDYLFTVAEAQGVGVNIETGVNQLGWVSWYSPIAEEGGGSWTARPDYYGMLTFAQASRGELLKLRFDTARINMNAHAVLDTRGQLHVTIINKDGQQHADVTIAPLGGEAKILRLTGPSLASKTGVTLGGSAVFAERPWQPRSREIVSSRDGVVLVHVPAASAAIVTSSAR